MQELLRPLPTFFISALIGGLLMAVFRKPLPSYLVPPALLTCIIVYGEFFAPLPMGSTGGDDMWEVGVLFGGAIAAAGGGAGRWATSFLLKKK